jgi:hypothetical protein
MQIKITCPNPKCKKPLHIDIAHAGKKVACTGCKQKIRLPTREELKLPAHIGASSNGAPGEEEIIDFDAMAAQAVHAEKAAADHAAKTTMIDLTCPQCDEKIQIAAEHSGKRAPCPACRRIIQVPKVDVGQPKDWREKEAQLPSLAKKEEVKLEGAWGNIASAQVSREALEEAAAIPQKKKKLTRVQLLQRVIYIAMVLVILGGAYWMFHRYRASSHLGETLTAAQALLTDAQAPPETKGLAELMLGEWKLGEENDKESQRQAITLLQQARTASGDPLWTWYLAGQSAAALGQVIALDPQQKDPLVDVQSIVQLIQGTPEGEPRENVFRHLCRSVIAQAGSDPEKVKAATTLLRFVIKHAVPAKAWTAPKTAKTPPGTAPAQDVSEQLDCTGVLAQELFRASAKNAASELIDQEKNLYQPGMPIPRLFFAMMTALSKPAFDLGKDPPPGVPLAQALGHLIMNQSQGTEVISKRLESGYAEDLLLPLLDAAEIELDAGRSNEALYWLAQAQKIAEIYAEKRSAAWKQRVYAHARLCELTAQAGDTALAEQRATRLKLDNNPSLNQLTRGLIAANKNAQGQSAEALLAGTVPGSGQVLAAFVLARKQSAATKTSQVDWADALPAGAVQTAARLGALVGARQHQPH